MSRRKAVALMVRKETDEARISVEMRVSVSHSLRRWGPAVASVLAGVAAQLYPEVLTPVVAAVLVHSTLHRPARPNW